MQYSTDDDYGQTRFTPERAAAWQKRALKQEFSAQPTYRQRDTLDRILALLVAEYERGQKAHSALWRNMDAWGFTPHLIALESARGAR